MALLQHLLQHLFSDGEGELEHDPDTVPSAGSRVDECFDALGNARRRRVVRIVHDLDVDGDGVRLTKLTEMIAAAENGKPVAELTSAERKNVYVALYQCHVPKLDGYGLVESDDRCDTIYATAETGRAVAAVESFAAVAGGDGA